MRVADYSPGSIDAQRGAEGQQQRADAGAKRRSQLEQSARDSYALGRNVGAALKRGDYAGAVEDSIGSTVAAVEGMPRPDKSPALLGALEAHQVRVTELSPPANQPAPDWQEREANLLPERLADPVSIYDDAGAAPAGQEIAPGAWSAYQTLKAEDDTATRAKGVLARMGDPEAQAAHAQQVEGARLHLDAMGRRSLATPELIEQARRAMGLAPAAAVPSVGRPSQYPQGGGADDFYGTGNESFVDKGMAAYQLGGGREATEPEVAADFQANARARSPEDTLAAYDLKPKKDAKAGKSNADAMAAANKSALVGLGLDPRNTVYTEAKPGEDAKYWGLTTPGGGKMMVDKEGGTTAAHESIHNAFGKMLKDKSLPDDLKRMIGDHDTQERTVRAAMMLKFGEAESEARKASGEVEENKDIKLARQMLKVPAFRKGIEKLEAYAAKMKAAERPGGPR
jgi:hypothetical protein